MSEPPNGQNFELEDPPQTCDQCQNIPDQYISLKCAHNLCLPCLALVYSHIRSEHPEINSQLIICPFDQSETLLDEFSIAALQKTIESTLQNSVEQPICSVSPENNGLSDSKDANPLLLSPEPENQDNKDDSPIEERFFERKENLIEKEAKKHQDLFRSCSKHRRETASLFCFTCETELLCVQCLVDGFHDQHEVKDLSKNPEVLVNKLERLLEVVHGVKENVSLGISELVSKQRIITNKTLEAKAQISNDFKEIREKINVREKELLQKTEEHSQDKIIEIEEEINLCKEKHQKLCFIEDKNHFSLSQKDSSIEMLLKSYKSLQNDMERIRMPSRKPLDADPHFKCYLNMDSFYKYLEGIQILKLEITGLTANKKKPVAAPNFARSGAKSYLIPNNNSLVESGHEFAGFSELESNEIKRRGPLFEKNKFVGHLLEKKGHIYMKPGYEAINNSQIGKWATHQGLNRSNVSFLQGYSVSDSFKDVNRSSLIFMKKMKEASKSRVIEDRQRSRLNTSIDRQRLMTSLEKQRSLFEKNKNFF